MKTILYRSFERRIIGWVSFLSILILLRCALNAAEPREELPLKEWQFVEDPAPLPGEGLKPPVNADWKVVTVPHVFRQSGLPDNTAGWYRQNIRLEPGDENRSIYLRLDGAASVKDVFVNGQFIGRHKGAFSAAVFDLTPALKPGQDNMLDVRVSNRDEETVGCFSRSNLFYVNGGMFRKALLVKTGAVHVFPDMGSSGVYLTPSSITSATADVQVRTMVKNEGKLSAEVLVRHSVTDPAGAACGSFESKQVVPAGEIATFTGTGKILQPKLWGLHQPNLYTVRSEVIVDGKILDVVSERTGFRSIAFRDKHFYLNGREVQFRGADNHEQSEKEWSALPDDDLRGQWQMMDDLGLNAVRLAHYPHRQLEYDIADERGMAVWAENGFAGQAWAKGGADAEKIFTPDGERLTREMVRQLWNHPSILFWSAGNETIVETVEQYAKVIREEDQDRTRLVTYAANGKEPKDCDFVARNTYDGWYGGHYTGFGKMPNNAIISETGAGDWVSQHVPYGTVQWKVNEFEPEEYAEMFAEYRLQTVCRDDAINRPMFFWWVFREFYDHKFKNNRNTKGLVTAAGMPKDIWYLFKAFLSPEKSVVHLCGRNHFLRGFAPDNGIKAYSNSEELELILNGSSIGKLKNGSYRLPDGEQKNKDGTVAAITGIPVADVFFWKTPLRPGRNVIEVSDGKGNTDRMIVYQKAGDGSVPPEKGALVEELQSSNPKNPAVFIDRAVEAQRPFYSGVDGSSDNTFDLLSPVLEGAGWISTMRMSDASMKTDLSFRIHPDSNGAIVFVIFSTGVYPTVSLKTPEAAIEQAAASLQQSLVAAGFKELEKNALWRDHQLNLANATIWSRTLKPGEKFNLPGQTLDYAILLRGL